MGQLFGSIYCWLDEFFGLELADYLWGMSAPEQVSNMYIGIGLSMLCISFFVAICYYYIIDHPRLSNWKGWLIFLGVNAVINFIVGWQWVLKDFYAGLMVKEDVATGKMVDLPIYTDDILAFGVTNMINAIIAFILISFIIKWWSNNSPQAPI
ncbi:MAG: hypothetical protein IJV23_03070 [Prevotella sp.]|nr:hypothetical protein [Prevotella sp.]